MITCWECGDQGHAAADCPNTVRVTDSGKPPWCGSCDERTRLVDLGDKMRRCGTCHPLKGRMLAQHQKCPACHEVIYVWDHTACDNHQPVGVHREYRPTAVPRG